MKKTIMMDNNPNVEKQLSTPPGETPTDLPADLFVFDPQKAARFTKTVMERSGQPLSDCYQCRRCAAGCPVNQETDGVTPNILIRMVLLGDEENALSNELIWKCVSCNTCGTRCPNDINTGRIVDTLKKMNKEAEIKPPKPEVVNFHASFFNDSLRWGRVNEMGFMGEYEFRNMIDNIKQKKFGAIFDEISTQTKFAFQMLKLNRLHLYFHKCRGRNEIKGLLRRSAEKK